MPFPSDVARKAAFARQSLAPSVRPTVNLSTLQHPLQPTPAARPEGVGVHRPIRPVRNPVRPRLRVLDLFTGLGGWKAAFQERGHDVTSVDIDPRFHPSICADVLKLQPKHLRGPWDLIVASPPCETFSVMTIGRHWNNGRPKSRAVRHAIRLLRHTLHLIRRLKPKAWIIENPRAMMRHVPDLWSHERRTVSYCQYGFPSMKPTDLWGGFPPTLKLHLPCKPREPCHEPSPRGSRTGTRGVATAARRALIPPALSMAVCIATENHVTRTGAMRRCRTGAA